MKPKVRIIVTFGICLFLIVAFYFAAGLLTNFTGKSITENNNLGTLNSVKFNSFVECLKKEYIPTATINSKIAMNKLRKITNFCLILLALIYTP